MGYGLAGAMVQRFQNDSDDSIVALRQVIDLGKLWAGVAPAGPASTPYVVISEISRQLVSECKGQLSQIFAVTLQIDCFTTNQSGCEQLLDLLEDAYVGRPLDISPHSWLDCSVSGRWIEAKDKTVRGILQLQVSVEKTR